MVYIIYYTYNLHKISTNIYYLIYINAQQRFTGFYKVFTNFSESGPVTSIAT